MIITNVIVEKIEKDNPRYPVPRDVEISEVYRCEVTFADGRQNEAVFIVSPAFGEMSPAKVGDMLNLFAGAITKAESAEAA